MNTLQINATLLDEAMSIAAKKQLDLNIAVENFIKRFISLNKKKKQEVEIDPFVASLARPKKPWTSTTDDKELVKQYLEEKYK